MRKRIATLAAIALAVAVTIPTTLAASAAVRKLSAVTAVAPYGSEVHGQYIDRTNVGPVGTLTPYTWTTQTAPRDLANVEITGGVSIKEDFTCTNCRIVGDPAATSGGYTVKHVLGTGKRFVCRNCEIITRSAVAKGLVSYGNGGVYMYRSVFRGGTDNAYLKPSTSHYTVGGVAYGHVFIETLFTDQQRYTGSHSDAVQIDGGAGGVLLLRSRIQSCNIPIGTDPLTTTAPTCPELASGGLILTYPSTSPEQIDKVALLDSCALGGNWTVDTDPPGALVPTNVTVSGNLWGGPSYYTYGPLTTSATHTVTNNTANACSPV